MELPGMASNGITLQSAVEQFYDVAVAAGKKQSTLRLAGLGSYCIQELASRGLSGARLEIKLPGGGRPKSWDVAWQHDSKYRLAISLKSILANVSGTVPNRLDDVMGETANLQMYSPEVVIGYLMIINLAADNKSLEFNRDWAERARSRMQSISGRRAPSWSIGMFEAFAIVEVDFSAGPVIMRGEEEVSEMFDILVAEAIERNPAAGTRKV